MDTKRPFFPPSSRLLVGIALVLVATGLAVAQWHYRVRGPLQTLAWFDAHRSPGDSLVYASAAYHAAHAQGSYSNRWRLTGYATLGTMGTLVGIGLILSGWRRRGSLPGQPLT
jgi:hypothetical protein